MSDYPTDPWGGEFLPGGPDFECPCGCPPDVHVGEVGCPCGFPDEPPCSPYRPQHHPEESDQ